MNQTMQKIAAYCRFSRHYMTCATFDELHGQPITISHLQGGTAMQRVPLPIPSKARAQRAGPLLSRQVHRGIAHELLQHGDSFQATQHHGAAGATGCFLHLGQP